MNTYKKGESMIVNDRASYEAPTDLHVAKVIEKETVEDNQVWLTSVDNPFDPFTDFDNWYRYDTEKGYYTAGLIARFTDADSFDLSDKDYAEEIEKAVERALETDLEGRLFKVVRINGQTKPSIHPRFPKDETTSVEGTKNDSNSNKE